MKKILNFFTGVSILILIIYGFIGSIFVPYYNWQYAKTHGFFKWLFFGEIVATFKALIWPYYVFF